MSIGFLPVFLLIYLLIILAHIAQLVEHFLGKEEVTGSNPVMSSIVKHSLPTGTAMASFFRRPDLMLTCRRPG